MTMRFTLSLNTHYSLKCSSLITDCGLHSYLQHQPSKVTCTLYWWELQHEMKDKKRIFCVQLSLNIWSWLKGAVMGILTPGYLFWRFVNFQLILCLELVLDYATDDLTQTKFSQPCVTGTHLCVLSILSVMRGLSGQQLQGHPQQPLTVQSHHAPNSNLSLQVFWKHYSDILVHINMIESHRCCQLHILDVNFPFHHISKVTMKQKSPTQLHYHQLAPLMKG